MLSRLGCPAQLLVDGWARERAGQCWHRYMQQSAKSLVPADYRNAVQVMGYTESQVFKF